MKKRNIAQYARISVFLILLVCALSIPEGMALSETDFQTIGSKYGVSPYLLLAISIIESQRGELTGNHEVQKVVDSTQLKFLRKIARHTGRDISKFIGSRAGAMGYMQIVPSTFYIYAQDGDGDGIKDPLNRYDSLATAAYFLARTIALKSNLRTALRSYNNSSVYCRKVLKLSEKLEFESTFAAKQE